MTIMTGTRHVKDIESPRHVNQTLQGAIPSSLRDNSHFLCLCQPIFLIFTIPVVAAA